MRNPSGQICGVGADKVLLRGGRALLLACLAACFVLFVVFFFIAQPACDDFVRGGYESTWLEYMRDTYVNWSGRWAGIGLSALVLPSVRMVEFYPVLIGLVAASSVCSFAVFFKYVFFRQMSWPRCFLCGLLAQLLLWACVPSAGEYIYWFTGASEYQLSVSLPLLILGGLANSEWGLKDVKGIAAHAALGVLTIFSMGLHELIGMVFLLILLSITVITFIEGSPSKYRWAVMTAVGAVGFMLVFFAPGNEARAAASGVFHDRHDVLHTVKSLAKIIYFEVGDWFVDPKLIAVSIFVWTFPGFRAVEAPWAKTRRVNLKIMVPVLWLAMVLVAFGAFYWAAGTKMAPRTLSGIYACFFWGWFVTLFIVTRSEASDDLPSKPLWGLHIAITPVLGAALLFTGSAKAAIYDLSHGALGWRGGMLERFEYARRSAEEHRLDIRVPRVPDSPYILVNGYLFDDPEYWRNKAFAEYFGLHSVTPYDAEAGVSE